MIGAKFTPSLSLALRIPWFWAVARGDETFSVEELTFKMNNFPARRFLRAVNFYLKLGTFLTEDENMLNIIILSIAIIII